MAKTKKNVKQAPALQEIVIRPIARRVSDVGTWRSALRSADYGRPGSLYDLYEDMLVDGWLWDAVDKRKKAVINAALIFTDRAGREVEAMTDMMDSTAFEDLLLAIMDTQFWGRSGVELDLDSSGKLITREIPHKHIDLDNRKVILDLSTPDMGVSYEDNPALIIQGKPRDWGILLKAMPYAIYKRGGFGDWSQWIELFGMPMRIGKYNSYDPASKRLMEEALERAGSAAYMAIPDGAQVDIMETKATSGKSFDEFRRACNEEISATILGNTLTTTSGERGARSLGEVHQDVEKAKNKSDMKYVQRILNSRVLPFLESRGMPVRGGRFQFPKANKEISVSETVQLSAIMPIPTSYLYDKYGIPVPDGDEPVAGSRGNVQEAEENPSSEGKGAKVENSDPFLPAPRTEAEAVERQMSWFERLTSSITAFLSDKLPVTRHSSLVALNDDYSIDLSKLLREAIKEVYGGEVELSPSLFRLQNDALQHAIDVAMGEPEFGGKNGAFLEQFRYNSAVFSAFKAHQETRAFVELLVKADGSLRSFREFRKLALRISPKWNEQWLRTEYNTAVRAARAAVKYRDALRTKHLYPNLKYIMSTAHNKRDDHLAYVGTVLPIEDPWWDDHLPPSAWNCQCGVEVTDEPVTKRPVETGIKPTFRNNAGKTAQFVNLKEHPYLKDQGHVNCPECRRMGLNENISNADELDQLCPMHKLAALYSREERKKQREKAEKAVLAWAKKNIPEGGITTQKRNIVSGDVIIYRRSIRDLLGHTPNPQLKSLAKDIDKILDKAVFRKEASLNTDSHNYEAKARRGAVGYRYYDVEVDGVLLQIDMEVRLLKGREIETPYAIREKGEI